MLYLQSKRVPDNFDEISPDSQKRRIFRKIEKDAPERSFKGWYYGENHFQIYMKISGKEILENMDMLQAKLGKGKF